MRHRSGFTLLEVLVAGSIAAMMMAALLGVMRDSAITLQSASGSEVALAVARNHLAMIEADISHAAPNLQGRDGAYRWEAHITREAVASPGPGVVAAYLARNAARPALYRVEITVQWREGGRPRQFRLATQRLGFAAPSGEPSGGETP